MDLRILSMVFDSGSLGPWFSDWNHRMMELLFRMIPHHPNTDDFFTLLLLNPAVSTWFFAASFYVLWAIDDEEQEWRRTQLFLIIVAIGTAVFITLGLRPWIAWPAPSLNPAYQSLFPPWFWTHGTSNCFPSHATLAYFIVALGLWRLHRGISVALSILVVAVISVPRIYLGGHYPIDVIASLFLGAVVLLAIWQARIPPRVAHWLVQTGKGSWVRELLLFVWLFELANGFSDSGHILRVVLRINGD
jgi:undecaprenyl-diphosphatase